MPIYRPTKYINFIAYCNKRKVCCKDYRNAKTKLFNGDLSQHEYLKKLWSIRKSAIELEIKYFDVLHMRH